MYATAETWEGMERFAIACRARRVIEPRRRRRIAGVGVEAFDVVHSIRAPAVGYCIRAGGAAVFYVPDVLAIPERAEALGGVDLYVGDGASLVRPIVRRRGRVPFGHAAMRTQLEWCGAEGVRRAIFTHCGSRIVAGDRRLIAARIEQLARANDVEASVARDGLVLEVPARKRRSRRGSSGAVADPRLMAVLRGASLAAGRIFPVAGESIGQ